MEQELDTPDAGRNDNGPEGRVCTVSSSAVSVEVEGRTVDVRVVPFGEVATRRGPARLAPLPGGVDAWCVRPPVERGEPLPRELRA
jgi:hypothetical protein